MHRYARYRIAVLACLLSAVAAPSFAQGYPNKPNDEIGKVVRSPDIQKQWRDRGYLSMDGSPEQYSVFVKQEIDKWGGVIRALGLTLD